MEYLGRNARCRQHVSELDPGNPQGGAVRQSFAVTKKCARRDDILIVQNLPKRLVVIFFGGGYAMTLHDSSIAQFVIIAATQCGIDGNHDGAEIMWPPSFLPSNRDEVLVQRARQSSKSGSLHSGECIRRGLKTTRRGVPLQEYLVDKEDDAQCLVNGICDKDPCLRNLVTVDKYFQV